MWSPSGGLASKFLPGRIIIRQRVFLTLCQHPATVVIAASTIIYDKRRGGFSSVSVSQTTGSFSNITIILILFPSFCFIRFPFIRLLLFLFHLNFTEKDESIFCVFSAQPLGDFFLLPLLAAFKGQTFLHAMFSCQETKRKFFINFFRVYLIWLTMSKNRAFSLGIIMLFLLVWLSRRCKEGWDSSASVYYGGKQSLDWQSRRSGKVGVRKKKFPHFGRDKQKSGNSFEFSLQRKSNSTILTGSTKEEKYRNEQPKGNEFDLSFLPWQGFVSSSGGRLAEAIFVPWMIWRVKERKNRAPSTAN